MKELMKNYQVYGNSFFQRICFGIESAFIFPPNKGEYFQAPRTVRGNIVRKPFEKSMWGNKP